jgi:hypothetical protein
MNEVIDAGLNVRETHDVADVIENADVLYVTRVQKERFNDLAQYEEVKNHYEITPRTDGQGQREDGGHAPPAARRRDPLQRWTKTPAPLTSARCRTACTSAWLCWRPCWAGRKKARLQLPGSFKLPGSCGLQIPHKLIRFVYQDGLGLKNGPVGQFVAHDDDFVAGVDEMRRRAVHANDAGIALAFDDVSFQTRAVGIVYHLHFFARPEAGLFQQGFVNGNAAHVIEVGLGDGGFVNFGV